MTVTLPSYREQQIIAAILSDMDNTEEALEALLIKVRAIKQGMMQRLLSTRFRLPEEESLLIEDLE